MQKSLKIIISYFEFGFIIEKSKRRTIMIKNGTIMMKIDIRFKNILK